jgi:hypothetical protein
MSVDLSDPNVVPCRHPTSSANFMRGETEHFIQWVDSLTTRIPTFNLVRRAEARMVNDHTQRHKPQHNLCSYYSQ